MSRVFRSTDAMAAAQGLGQGKADESEESKDEFQDGYYWIPGSLVSVKLVTEMKLQPSLNPVHTQHLFSDKFTRTAHTQRKYSASICARCGATITKSWSKTNSTR